MSSRLKERGGGGGKTIGSKPHTTPKEKRSASAARRTPVACGKENPRTLSGGKISAARPNPSTKLVEKPAAVTGVRWSTSSLPRGKVSNPSDLISDLSGDRRLPRVSTSDRLRPLGRDLEAEAGGRRSFGGTRASDKHHQAKGLSDKGLKKNDERLISGISAPQNQNSKPNGLLGLQVAKKDTKTSDMSAEKLGGRIGAAAASEKYTRKSVAVLKPILAKDDGSSGKGVSTKLKTEAPFPESNPGNLNEGAAVETSKNEVFQAAISTSIDGKATNSIFSRRGSKNSSYTAPNTKSQDGADENVVHVSVSDQKKDRLAIQQDTSKEMGDGIKIKDIPSEKVCINTAPLLEVSQKTSAKISVFDKVIDNLKNAHAAPKYPSKLHEKLAMLEGKVQRIASEIKRTKEMLDNNNSDDSKLILSDIQSQISGIEKAVAHAIDGTVSELGSSKIIKVDCQQNKEIISSQTGKPDISTHLVKEVNHEELEARFFPHHKLLRDRRSSVISEVYSSSNNCDPDFEDGPLSPIDENPIALKFLASLNPEQAMPIKHVMVSEREHATVRASGFEKSSSVAECDSVSRKVTEHSKSDIELLANEELEEFDNLEKKPAMILNVDAEADCKDQLCKIGQKPSTGGWFVSEGEAVLLAHHDGSCSYYDIANSEFKAEYKPPAGVSNDLWGDCWLIRASGADGCSGKYVVAASAGNALESGFCSWDYYTKEVKAFSIGDVTNNSSSSRTTLGSLSNIGLRRSMSSATPTVGHQWWYKPCGPLLISTASKQKSVNAYDIRDGDLVMKWEVSSPVLGMEYSSPLQWRSRGKVIIAGTETISLWDVNSLNPQPLLSVASGGKKVYSLHVNNTDAELGGGVRQRVSLSDVEGNDGVFCTQDSINVLDLRLPSGVGIKVSRHGGIGHSVFSRGDSIFVGSTEGRLPIKGCPRSRVQQYSLRKGKLVTTYELPEFNSHFHHYSLTQVWGDANIVMGICGMGLYVFNALQDERSQAFCFDRGNAVDVREVIGPDDLYCPSFDYSGSRVLVISRDRPASWRYLYD
ncbi:hypothetical protein Cni_G28100 [Canna indica]|uniref:At4g14310 8-bladed propeller domain-containing protein n=1 Tax=Canna indica TaxID=4628 RepID=A0AAQ3L1Z5_9LILI|nr:hypothetical protein Cni_G28100 [Canna indica]